MKSPEFVSKVTQVVKARKGRGRRQRMEEERRCRRYPEHHTSSRSSLERQLGQLGPKADRGVHLPVPRPCNDRGPVFHFPTVTIGGPS